MKKYFTLGVLKLEIQELKEQLQSFSCDDDIGIIVYLVLKNQAEEISIKMADIDSEHALPSLKDYFLFSINQRIIEKEELQIMNISEADERKNVIYQYDLIEKPAELSIISTLLENERQPTFNFSRDNFSDIKAYIVIMGNNQKKLLLYKKHYPISLLKRDSQMMLMRSNERFVRFNEELIRLDNNFQFFALNDVLFIKDLEQLEKFFGFHDLIKREALGSISKIEQAEILADVEVLREAVENIAFARKLTKLSVNSPVLEGDIPIQTIIQFTQTNPALAGRLKYNHDESKIVLDTKVSQNLFVKLLNDDYLKSELTQMHYDSLAKDKISNVGA